MLKLPPPTLFCNLNLINEILVLLIQLISYFLLLIPAYLLLLLTYLLSIIIVIYLLKRNKKSEKEKSKNIFKAKISYSLLAYCCCGDKLRTTRKSQPISKIGYFGKPYLCHLGSKVCVLFKFLLILL